MLLNDFDRQAVDESFYILVVHTGKLPARLNMELLGLLQQQEAAIFTPKVVYDGRKIIFSIHDFLGENNSQKVVFLLYISVYCTYFLVQFVVSRPRSNGSPKIYEIILTKTATINSE
jgi:hypothetical protein